MKVGLSGEDELSINQGSVFPKQNVNKMSKVLLSVDEAHLSNLYEIKILAMFIVSHIEWKNMCMYVHK